MVALRRALDVVKLARELPLDLAHGRTAVDAALGARLLERLAALAVHVLCVQPAAKCDPRQLDQLAALWTVWPRLGRHRDQL